MRYPLKALVPFNNEEHFEAYQIAGAGEFYIGFYEEAWEEEFGEYADLNRLTGYKKSANKYSFEEILPIIQKVKSHKLAIYVTFNSSIYTQEQLNFMERYMEPLHAAGADGIIVSCPELVPIGKKYRLNVVISTIAGIYNSDIAKYYWKLGVERIILPRDLSILDIEKIVHAVPDVEYEVFMMRNGCSFSDSNCLGLHRSEKPAICAALCNGESELAILAEGFQNRHDAELNNLLYHNIFHSYACGLCSLYRFVKLGIAAGKIVGRTDCFEEVCEDIRLICDNVNIAKECSSEEEYLNKMKFPSKNMIMCKMGLNCYYPETRF
ncbi:peptidase U32 family protein [[Clostridium] polysaccharolyticum]|uniref:Putative protease n=1 Tax=[Clostridium] polysaccharolyticum TaxID=29364 RepID=A0A1I0DLY9_9FIRM|nr:U32 family peptidase [[Clostridium] polysaccharolyticum]SET32705.1 putative protease [[Clostridium] polysaccharolyticum]